MQFAVETQYHPNRRQWLRGLAATGVGALILAACGTTSRSPQPPTHAPTSIPPFQPEPIGNHLGLLPNTPISNLLRQRMSDFYTEPYPRQINRGGIAIPIYAATLVQTTNGTQDLYSGEATMIKTYNGMDRGNPVSEVTIPYVIPTYLNEVEKQDLKAKNFLSPDGNFGISFRFLPSSEIASGITPQITINIPSYPDKALTSFIVIKEAFSLFLMDLIMERIAKQLQSNGTSSSINIRTADGQIESIETVTTAYAEVMSKRTRVLTVTDLGALALTVSELLKTNVPPIVLNNPMSKLTVPKLNGIDFGSTPEQIYDRTAEWTVRNALPASQWSAKPGEPAFYQGTVTLLP